MIIFVVLIFVIPVCGEEIPVEAYSADEFNADSILDALPDELKERLPGGDLFSEDGFTDAFSMEYFFGVIGDIFTSLLSPSLKLLSQTLGLVLVASSLSAMRGTVGAGTLDKVFEFVSGLCLMTVLYENAALLVEAVREYLYRLTSVVSAMVPVMLSIGIAGGNVTSSTLGANAMMISLAFVETLAAHILFPILQLCFGLSAASGLGGIRLSGISKTVRGVMTWVIALIGAVISAVMTFQTSIAARADSLSIRAVKFAASNAVPVVGGMASDAVGTVASSLSLIKSTVGWVGVIIIAVLTLPIIMNVLLARFGVSISETAADIIGLEGERGLLSEMCGLLGFLAAVCVIASLMFIYALALFAKSTAALGG